MSQTGVLARRSGLARHVLAIMDGHQHIVGRIAPTCGDERDAVLDLVELAPDTAGVLWVEPSVVVGLVEDHRHAVVQRCHDLVGRACDDGAGRDLLARHLVALDLP
jgi:hypothetical protein